MKIYIFSLLLIIGLLRDVDVLSQSVIGSWQRDADLIGSGTGEMYKFHKDGKFQFFISQYIYMNSILSFSGTYVVKDGRICFKIIEREEIIGGHIEQGSLGFQDNWVLEGGTIEKVKQDSIVNYCFDCKLDHDNNNRTVMQLGNAKYYKIKDE